MPEPSPERVEELFNQAADLAPDQRRQFLATACGGDTRLLAQVEALLRHDDGSAPTASLLVNPFVRAASAPPSTPPPTLPGYEVLGVLGSGGMGVVYKARQTSLNRVVALKMLHTSIGASPVYAARFRVEAEVLARLQHPNIIQVFDFGEQEGQAYFAMEYVDGPSLAAVLEQGPQPPAASARLIEVLARAMHAVHQQGIVHRDLKPANILLMFSRAPPVGCAPRTGPDPVRGAHPTGGARLNEAIPKITDFGIAKLLDKEGSQTQSGSILGTPWYMAPEQAEGRNRAVGPAADVYALGAMLYKMLTGRPPFQGVSLLETLQQVRTLEPVTPRQLQPHLPRDLETICLKCLQKEPARRYASAEAVAEDLARYRAGQPIRARPVSRVARAYRWCRRRPLVAALGAGIVVLAVALVVSVLAYQAQLRQALAQSEQTAEARRQLLVQVNVSSGLVELDHGNSLLALLWFTEALHLDKADPDRERNHRTRIGVTLRQSPRLVQLLGGNPALSCVRLSPDGRWLLTASGSGMARLWDRKAGAAGLELPHDKPVGTAAFSPDGRLLATITAGGTVRVWQTATGQPQTPPLPEGQPIDQAAFDPSGQLLVIHRADHRVRLRMAATGEPIAFAELTAPAPAFSAISDDGRRILTVDNTHAGRIWDLSTGAAAPNPLALGQPVTRAAIRRDGRFVAVVAGDGSARIWSVASGKPLAEPLRHSQRVTDLAFSPTGDRLATAAADLTAKVWRSDTGELLSSGLRQEGVLKQVVFSADGKLLLTCGGDNQARLWEAASGAPFSLPLPHNGSVFYAAFLPGGRRLVTAAADDTVRVWELPRPVPTGPPTAEPPPAVTEARSPDGRWLVSFGQDPFTQVTEAATGATVSPPLRHGSQVTFAVFSPNGDRVVTCSDDNTARIWDRASGARLVPPLVHRGTVSWAAFSPDGRRLITASEDHSALVWDATTGERLTPALRHPCSVRQASFSADGSEAITVGEDRLVRTWDLTPDDRPVARLVQEAEVLSGHRLDEQHGLVPLEPERLRAAWERLHSDQ